MEAIGRIAFDATTDFQEERVAVGSSGVRFGLDPTVAPANVPSFYSRFNQSYSETNYDLLLNFNKKISESFSFTGLLGTNVRRTRLSSIKASNEWRPCHS